MDPELTNLLIQNHKLRVFVERVLLERSILKTYYRAMGAFNTHTEICDGCYGFGNSCDIGMALLRKADKLFTDCWRLLELHKEQPNGPTKK